MIQTTASDPKAVVERSFDAVNRHDLEAFLEYFHPDYQSDAPSHPGRAFRGRETVRKNWSGIFANIPDITVEMLWRNNPRRTGWPNPMGAALHGARRRRDRTSLSAKPARYLNRGSESPISMLDYAHPEVLVDTQWVAEHLTAPKVRVVEVGYDLSDYNSGHIPGAVGWTWNSDFQHPIRKDLPDKEGMEALLARSSIENDTTIVVYGARRHGYATFALWLLKIYGHGDVRVMNGNREKWIAEGRPLTTEVSTVTPSVYIAREPDWSIRALRDWVLDSIGNPERILVDVRTPEEYHGQLWDWWKYQAEASQRGGHIPGAVNIPWDVTLKEDGTFKSVEELQTLYTNNGVTSDKEVISYCIVGGRSNHTWFVLTYLLGYPIVRLYDGSWAEWSTLIGVPIEK